MPQHHASVQVQALQEVLSLCDSSFPASENRSKPFCSGTATLPQNSGKLFYENYSFVADNNDRKAQALTIDLMQAAPEELEALARSCELRTTTVTAPPKYGFGRSRTVTLQQQHVDGAQWRVVGGEMDPSQFAAQFDVYTARIMERVNRELLGQSDLRDNDDLIHPRRALAAELNKLMVHSASGNDHGHGRPRKNSVFTLTKSSSNSASSFSACTADTDMTAFGTLIVFFPTPHDGGTIVMRAGGDKCGTEWNFDASALWRSDKQHGNINGSLNATIPNVAFVAFTSDVVAQEPTPIRAGYRVALKYTLRLTSPPTLSLPLFLGSGPTTTVEEQFSLALMTALADPSFLPTGGVLGFGLECPYPGAGDAAIYPSFSMLASELRARDLLIWQVCTTIAASSQYRQQSRRHLSPPELGAVYSQNGQHVRASRPILLGRGPIECPIPPMIHRRCGGVMVHSVSAPPPRTAEGRAYGSTEAVLWVVGFGDGDTARSRSRFETPYVALGSRGEASLAYITAHLCITAKVGPISNPIAGRKSSVETPYHASNASFRVTQAMKPQPNQKYHPMFTSKRKKLDNISDRFILDE